MDNNNSKEEIADFSGFLNKDQAPGGIIQNPSPIQEYKKAIVFTKRIKYLVAVLGLLAVAQVTLIFITQNKTEAQVPEGYRLVTPEGQPAYIEKIK